MIIEMEEFSKIEQKLLLNLLKEIEILALKYELKQPKQCIGGF